MINLKTKVTVLTTVIVAASVAFFFSAMFLLVHSIESSGAIGGTANNAYISSVLYNNDYTLKLSKQEKSWLNKNYIIRVGIDRSFPPFGSITEENKYIGFTADYMRLIEYRAGLSFVYEKDKSWSDTLKMAKAGEIDMISALVNTKSRQQFLDFSAPFIKKPTSIFGRAGSDIQSLQYLKGKKVAIERGSYASEMLGLLYPEIQLVLAKDTKTALNLLSDSSVDAYVGNSETANYLIKKYGFSTLIYISDTPFSSEHSIGFVKPNSLLTSIVNKTLASITKQEKEEIASHWFGVMTQSFISKKIAYVIGAILFTLLLSVGLWSASLRATKNKLKISKDDLKLQSEIDELTQLGNRRKFYQLLNEEISQSNENKRSFALFFLDLDMFKEVNDSLGHSIGDVLLIDSSKRITDIVADKGSVSRLGGDEFVIILHNASNDADINKIAEMIRSRLSYAFIIQGNEINITASIGITRFPNDAQTADQLVMNGDQAMYHSKKKGRNCYTYFNQEMQAETHYKNNLIKDLRIAVQGKDFTLNYQPIIKLSSNRITKAEALIRWNHTTRGYVSPVEFIPLAEEVRLINEIGEWAFKAAMDQTVDICKVQDKHFQMTVNTSPLQYRKNAMSVTAWCKYLDSCGLSGENLVVEITEGVLMGMSDSVKQNLFELRDLNISVAIDDFGTGYSSLSYLTKFDIDFLKIDQSFVRNLTVDSDDHALIQTIIVMAHRLGIKVIAEGIETKEQRDILVDANCDFGQGYYFSKPLNAKDFMGLLEHWDDISKQRESKNVIALDASEMSCLDVFKNSLENKAQS